MLTDEEIASRIQLYKSLSDARKMVANITAEIPEECPPSFFVDWPEATGRAQNLVGEVCVKCWRSLRDAALAAPAAQLEAVEERVRKFEAGEDVDAPPS